MLFLKRFELIKGSRFFLTRSLPPKSWKQGHELINDGDDRHIMDSHFGVINYNHPVGVIAFNTLDSGSARGHESIVGIQLAQLARPNFHVQHDALGLEHILFWRTAWQFWAALRYKMLLKST